MWRRLLDAVVLRSRIPIDVDPLEPLGVWILQVLDDPQPSAIVKLDRHRLPHQRLRRHDADLKSLGDGHPRDRFIGRESLRQRGRCVPDTDERRE